MRSNSRLLLSFIFASALGASGGAAFAQPNFDPDAAIVTAAPEILPSVAEPLTPARSVTPGPLNLSSTSAAASLDTSPAEAAHVEPNLAAAPPAEQNQPTNGPTIIGLGGSAARPTGAENRPVATGGFLRANPQLERPNRRKLGLALRF